MVVDNPAHMAGLDVKLVLDKLDLTLVIGKDH